VGVWIIFHVGSGLELKHMKKGKIELPRRRISPTRDGLTAGVFTGSTEVGGPCLKTSALTSA
jgi:hypothetical protein